LKGFTGKKSISHYLNQDTTVDGQIRKQKSPTFYVKKSVKRMNLFTGDGAGKARGCKEDSCKGDSGGGLVSSR
jgi:hypothetical protein